jgi:hypothetical protein
VDAVPFLSISDFLVSIENENNNISHKCGKSDSDAENSPEKL